MASGHCALRALCKQSALVAANACCGLDKAESDPRLRMTNPPEAQWVGGRLLDIRSLPCVHRDLYGQGARAAQADVDWLARSLSSQGADMADWLRQVAPGVQQCRPGWSQ